MAGYYDIGVNQGEDFSQLFTYKQPNASPYDITGWTAKMAVRLSYGFDGDPLLELQDGAGITLGGAAGTVLVAMTRTETLGLPTGELVYDIFLVTNTSVHKKFLFGKCIVAPAVTTT